MEYFGLIAFCIAMTTLGHTSRLNKLEAKIRKINNQKKGANIMSKMINELVDKQCKIVLSSGDVEISFSDPAITCKVLDVDDEWMKIQFEDKKKNVITKIIRIDDIAQIDILN